MGKPKKGKKLDHDEDNNSDQEVDNEGKAVVSVPKTPKEKKGKNKNPVEEKGCELTDEEEGAKKRKSKKDKKKKHGGDSEEDDVETLTKGLEPLPTSVKARKEKKTKTKDVSGETDETRVSKRDKAKKSVADDSGSEAEETVMVTSAVKPKGGFALLAVSDDESMEEQPAEESEEEVVVTTKREEKKGKKGKKKNKEEDDEDIEKMLAELDMEYRGEKKEAVAVIEELEKPEEDAVAHEKKKKKKKAVATEENDAVENKENGGEETGGMKTAAQKKKEKKERERLKKFETKKKDKDEGEKIEDKVSQDEPKNELEPEHHEENDEEKDDKKKKKKGKGKEVVEDPSGKKGPGKKTIAAMKEALQKLKEEEEKARLEEEEKIRREEEAENARLEQLRLEQERKDKKKQREKERKERLKAEGKLLTSKQKADRARAQATLDALRAQGLDVPDVGEKKPRLGTRVRTNKKTKTDLEHQKEEEVECQPEYVTKEEAVVVETKVEVEIVDRVSEVVKEEEDVKDSWDAESSDDDEEKSEGGEGKAAQMPPPVEDAPDGGGGSEEEDDEDSDSDDEEEDESSEAGSDDESSDESEVKSDAQKKRERALERIRKRREEAEASRTLDVLRAAVVCVLGHVDTGKTKILDKLRRTNVQDGEAGGITQQIGATNVPIDAIKEQTKIVKGFADLELRMPGLLIIDTPGHESFSNLRNRGSSLCDIAILVVDIMHGLEPQTLESINLLKAKKTPFVVALNKIDRLYDWQTMARRDVHDVIKSQATNTQLEFEQRTKEVCLQFSEQGLNAALFYENPDPRSYVSLVPTSAITGEGMGNLLALIVENCQNMLAKRLMFSPDLQATVLEVKAVSGLGTTIDAILINGYLREGDTMILAGTDGPIVTQIRSLLMPQPMRELRVKNAYVEHREIQAAQGVKIAAKDLEKAIAGLNLQIAQKPDEVEIFREEVARELKSALSSIKLQERGVYVQASTLGSLEALLEFLKVSKIPYSNIRIGPVVKKDVMKASTMLEHDSQYATILAFDVKIERDAQELAETLGVKIFQADIIYHLFDKFMAYREELRQQKRDQFKSIAVFPCKLKVLPQYVFNSRDPIVMGVIVEAGIVREGTPICVPSREFVDLGIVSGIENNHKSVESARKGQEVCIKIEPIPGEAPKMFGRHFDEKDFLISKISRQSIDACKDYFRDDLAKTDWQLMVELKKLFQIL